ncbi:hypothetical protein ACN4DP_10215 [Corynebacterium macclintockiae]|uniref:hypothetical protein n=1 Tax=Corynebacterium macclintockiae TaxID=2913501 RepID=UPI003EB9D3B5
MTAFSNYHQKFDPIIDRTLGLKNKSSILDVLAKTFLEVSAPFLENIPPKLLEGLQNADYFQINELAEHWLEITDEKTYQALINRDPHDLIIDYGKISSLAEAACCIDPSNLDEENLFYFLVSLSSVVVDPQETMSKHIR